jgi:hypothetical protein
LYHFQPDPNFYFSITTTIAIKNRSGKIADRFSFRNRIPIFPAKSIRDFRFQIGSRLKNGFGNTSIVGMDHRDPIFVRKSISDFEIKIDPRL